MESESDTRWQVCKVQQRSWELFWLGRWPSDLSGDESVDARVCKIFRSLCLVHVKMDPVVIRFSHLTVARPQLRTPGLLSGHTCDTAGTETCRVGIGAPAVSEST